MREDEKPVVIPATLGWANPDTGPVNLRAYATDQGDSPRWAKPRARVIEDALIEAGCREGDRIAVVVLGDRFTDVTAGDVRAALRSAWVASSQAKAAPDA